MICKNCKTAVSDADKACAYCGKPVNAYKSLKRLSGILVMTLLTFFCGAYLYASVTGMVDFSEREPDHAHEPSLEEKAPAAPPVSTPQPTGAPDVEAEEIPPATWTALEDAYLAGKSYMINNADTSFTSNLGYLYDHDNKKYVTMSDLDSQELLDETLVFGDIWLLYINGQDLNSFDELNFSLPDKPNLFAACETSSGVAILSQNNYGVMYRENFPALMENYAFEFPEVYYPTRGKLEYEEITSAVKAYEFDEKDYDVRYLATDGKYAYIIFSKGVDTNILYQYLLAYEDGAWQVVLPRVAQKDGYVSAICRVAMDMNYSVLPPFRVDKHTMREPSYFDFVRLQLIDSGMLSEGEYETLYLSGTDECFYMETSTGLKLVGLNMSGQWAMTPVDGKDSAYAILMNFNPENPPVFILKQ